MSDKHEKPCPNCGHCPTCGKSNFKPQPQPWPYQRYYPIYPYWSVVPYTNTVPVTTWPHHNSQISSASGGSYTTYLSNTTASIG